MPIEPSLLELYLASTGLDPYESMNALQEHNIISDLCVTAADVADADCQRAVEFLRGFVHDLCR
jgi:hypothetical protein